MMYKRSFRSLSILILLSIILISVSTVLAWEIDKTTTVISIIDGDTFDIPNDRVRLADIDAPESGESKYSQAKNALSNLISGKTVYLDKDPNRGPYGRIIAVVYIKHNSTHYKNVNKALLGLGVGVVVDNYPNEFNPSSWTLYVQYAPSPDPPALPDPDPAQDPPQDPPDSPDLVPEPPPQPTNKPPIVINNGPYQGAEDQEIQFSSEGSYDTDGSIIHYRWVFGDGGYSAEENPTHWYTESGYYLVSLTLTDNEYGRNSSTTSCIVTSKPNQPPIPIINGPYEGIVNNNIFFRSTDSRDPDGYQLFYEWSFGDGTTSDERNPSHVYAEAGNYNVSLSITDSGGLSTQNQTTCSVRIALGSVRIQIKDENSSQSLSGVLVKSSLTPAGQRKLWRYSDEDGLAEFIDIRNGHYVFCASRDGFVSEEMSVYVIENVSMPRSIRISKNETYPGDDLLVEESEPEFPPEPPKKGFVFDPILIIPAITIGGVISLFLLLRLRAREQDITHELDRISLIIVKYN